MLSNRNKEKQVMEEICSGALTDARAVAVGGEVLGELPLGGADEVDGDLVGRGGCPGWGGGG